MTSQDGSSKCTPGYQYYNFLITVPDRTGLGPDQARAAALRFFDKLFPLKDKREWGRIVREPYREPTAEGHTHHFHLGYCFVNPRRWAKARLRCKASKHWFGAHFDHVQAGRGRKPREIFTKYFDNPSKYKRLDETGGILIPVIPPLPPAPLISDEAFGDRHARADWGGDLIRFFRHPRCVTTK